MLYLPTATTMSPLKKLFKTAVEAKALQISLLTDYFNRPMPGRPKKRGNLAGGEEAWAYPTMKCILQQQSQMPIFQIAKQANGQRQPT
jgi:hypothetical protein